MKRELFNPREFDTDSDPQVNRYLVTVRGWQYGRYNRIQYQFCVKSSHTWRAAVKALRAIWPRKTPKFFVIERDGNTLLIHAANEYARFKIEPIEDELIL